MILNADDFGYSAPVDEGILALVEAGRISSTSVMVKKVAPKRAMQLKRFEHKIDIGLHLESTEDEPLSFARLSCRAYARRLSRAAILTEIRTQLERFQKMFGREPDFLDGHQHVHQLPVVREAVLQAAVELKGLKYVRAAGLPLNWLARQAPTHPRWVAANGFIILPGCSLKRSMKRRGLLHNRFLLGYYDYGNESFATVFERYLTLRPLSTDVFFCHPALPTEEDDTIDPIYQARLDAFAFLNSSRFEQLQSQYNFSINRFPALGPASARPSTRAGDVLI